MDHETAIRTEAAERYILAEMPPAERDEFEEHYFDCAICAEDVKALDDIRTGARERETANVVPFRRAKQVILPWAAAASLLLLVGYQNAVSIPRLAARVPPPISIIQQESEIASETRAGATIPVELRASQLAVLAVDIVHDPQYARYEYQLRRGTEVLGGGPIDAAQTQTATVPLLLQPLPAGSYEVVIEGVRKEGNRSEITRQQIVVK